MKKSKKFLSVLATVLLMTVMTFTTVFAATSYPKVVEITLNTNQGVARAGTTQDTTGNGYFWGKNDTKSAGEVYLIPKVRKATINYWHDMDKVVLDKGESDTPIRENPFSGHPNVHWSVELNPKGANKSGCYAKARAGMRVLTDAEKKW